jgi:putative salt-induced outer membrane protein YdiY
MKRKSIVIALTLLLSVAVMADAVKVSNVASEFSTYKKVKASKELKQSINFGFSNVTGNTEAFTLNGKYTLSVTASGYNNKPLQIMFDASAFVTENNDVKDNEEYTANLALEQFVLEKWLVYTSVHWLRNKFRNYDNKSSIAAGVGKKIFDDGQHIFKLRAGFAYNIEQYTNDQPEEKFFSFNQYLEYTNQLNKVSALYVKVGLLENLENFSDDYEVLAVAGFNFAVAENISVILEEEVRYDNLPPIGFGKTDTKTIFKVGYNF